MALAAAALLLALAACCIWLAFCRRKSSGSWQRAYGLAVLINVISVSIDGRFDSDADPTTMSFPWPTLFAPAGFAFAIWGIIYLGEMLGLVLVLRGGDSNSALSNALSASTDSWLAANIGQALWCAAFRPWALELLWLSTALLATAAACLVQAQRRLLTAEAAPSWELSKGGGALRRAAIVWPRSLHAGWLLAATLVNLNAYVGRAGYGPAAALATAVASFAAAAVLGGFLVTWGLPVAAAALAWASFAVSVGRPVGADAAALGAPTLAGLATAASLVSCALCVAVAAPLVLGAARGAWRRWRRRGGTDTLATVVAVGTANPGKLAAVAAALRSFGMDDTHSVVSIRDAPSGVPEQPLGLAQTERGAKNRAEAARRAAQAHAHGAPNNTAVHVVGIGLESGLLAIDEKRGHCVDVCCCSIFDGRAHSSGWSSGWVLPPQVVLAMGSGGAAGERESGGGASLNDALAAAAIPPDDRGGGALAQLSGGVLSRPAQMAQAVELALLAVRNPALYAPMPPGWYLRSSPGVNRRGVPASAR